MRNQTARYAEPDVTSLLLLVLVADPSTEISAAAMAASTADGLEGRAVVDLERVSKLPADDEAIHRADVAKASAVIEVSWPDADGRRAHLHAHLKPSGPWIDRDVTFAATSKPWERGRAIGLAIAAMLPDEAEPPAPTPEPAKEPEPPPPPPIAPVVSERPKDVVAPPPRPSAQPTRTHFDASLVGELGEAFRGERIGSGARLGVTWWAHRDLGVRVLGGVRSSSVDAAGAVITHFDAGAGLAARLYGTSDRFRLVLFGDLRIAREGVARTRTDGVEEERGRWLPTIALTTEAGLGLTGNLALIATLGPEIALGRTTLAVKDAPVAALPRVVLFGGLGLRWSL